MGSPVSTTVANLFMEEFEIKAINSAPCPPRLWLRYVDNTSLIQKAEHSKHFLYHINSINLHIQFTQETADHQGFIPFLDYLVPPGPDNTLLITVYRKPTHTDQYLPWDSHHNFSA